MLISNSLSINATARTIRPVQQEVADHFTLQNSSPKTNEVKQVEIQIPESLTISERIKLIDLYLCFKVKAILGKPIGWTYGNGVPVNRGIVETMNDWINRDDKSQGMQNLLLNLEKGGILTLEDMAFYIQEYCSHFNLRHSAFTKWGIEVFKRITSTSERIPSIEEVEIKIPERLSTASVEEKQDYINRFLLDQIMNNRKFEKPKTLSNHRRLESSEIKSSWFNREDESDQMKILLSGLAQGKPLTLGDMEFYLREYCRHFDLPLDLQHDDIITRRATETFINILKLNGILPIAKMNITHILVLLQDMLY